MREARRTRPTRRRGVRPDLQATVRASLRYGGEPLDRRWREHVQGPRKLVLVCDVSGSMAPYARMLLQYLHAAVATHRRVEAFVFGTRLTRVTHELGVRDPDRALDRAAAAVVDWSGGTRIGDVDRDAQPRARPPARARVGDRDPLRRLGPRRPGAARDRDGAPAALPRTASIWLNPLKAAPDYEPLARGMAAALPHIDHFLAGNSLALAGRARGTAGRRTRMRDVLRDVDAWTARGDKVALAMVVAVKRSAPRPPGAKMAISSSGEVSGAVSGGCVEGAVVEVAEKVLSGGEPRAPALRHRRRGGVGRRAAVRRRDRRLGGALRAVSAAAGARARRRAVRPSRATSTAARSSRDARAEPRRADARAHRRVDRGLARRPRARPRGRRPCGRAHVGRALGGARGGRRPALHRRRVPGAAAGHLRRDRLRRRSCARSRA